MVCRSASCSWFCTSASSATGYEKISLYNRAAAGPSGYTKSRACVGQELSPGASPLAMAEGTSAGQMQKQVDLNCSHWSPSISPWSSGIRRSPAGWRQAVSSPALLLETFQPCLPHGPSSSLFMDPREQRASVFGMVFSHQSSHAGNI